MDLGPAVHVPGDQRTTLLTPSWVSTGKLLWAVSWVSTGKLLWAVSCVSTGKLLWAVSWVSTGKAAVGCVLVKYR